MLLHGNTQINLDDTLNDDAIFVLTVDGTHFRTRECRKEPNANWFSYKFHGPGLSYEFGIAIHKNQLCWINGPFRASSHDAVIFDSKEGDFDDPITKFRSPDGLASRIPEGKMGFGDNGGYSKFKSKVSTRDKMDEKDVYEYKNRALARHEIFNGRVKTWRMMSDTWIHALDKHIIVLEAICVIEQYRMENGHPLLDV